MRFLTFEQASTHLRGRTVAVVGSAPSVLDNEPGFIDSHDVVVRVNNYKLAPPTGRRTDVYFSFFGTSIKKTAQELAGDGVKLCWCKLPDAKPIQSEWHEITNRVIGIDFRPHYARRRNWWFCDTYIPTVDHFLRSFEILDRHMPTSGFAAILDTLACDPKSVYLTGFDFFTSGVHNVNETWRPGDPRDPIGHDPERERQWLKRNIDGFPIELDKRLQEMLT